jgi:hypothetical protein
MPSSTEALVARAMDARVSVDLILAASGFVFPNGATIAQTHGAPVHTLRPCHQDKWRVLSKERAIDCA